MIDERVERHAADDADLSGNEFSWLTRERDDAVLVLRELIQEHDQEIDGREAHRFDGRQIVEEEKFSLRMIRHFFKHAAPADHCDAGDVFARGGSGDRGLAALRRSEQEQAHARIALDAMRERNGLHEGFDERRADHCHLFLGIGEHGTHPEVKVTSCETTKECATSSFSLMTPNILVCHLAHSLVVSQEVCFHG